MYSGTINNNIAPTGSGGVALGSSAIFNMHGGTISNNEATSGNAGGVGLGHGVVQAIDYNTYFNMFGGIIENNRANNGGGVNVAASVGNAYFTMTGGIIRNNRNNAAGDPIIEGGGVRIDGTRATFYMYGGTIGGYLNPTDPELRGNLALSGGGVWVGNGASFYMLPGVANNNLTYGRIIGNEATGQGTLDGGGGVLVIDEDSTVVVRAGIIGGDADSGEGNTAFRGGGGVCVYNGAELRMEAGSILINGTTNHTRGYISGNLVTGPTAGHGGGGVFLWAAPASGLFAYLVMEAGVIGGSSGCPSDCDYCTPGNNCLPRTGNIGQHGGGIFAHTRGKIDMSGGIISGNESVACGGGINLGANIHHNYMAMTGGTIGGYLGGEGNIAGTDGGGVRVGSTSFFDMYDGRIIGNTAEETGGGVVVLSEAVFNMYGGTIGSAEHNSWGNSAPRGGGVNVGLGWGITNVATSFNFYGGTIGRNTADFGGGVLLNDNVAHNTFNLRGNDPKIITGNRATFDGGGVFVGWEGWNQTAGIFVGGHMRMQETPTQAINVHITNNRAGRMGGGIFTEHKCYNDPLLLVPANNYTGEEVAYSNLTLFGVTFGGNTANRLFWPPSNARDVIPTSAFVALSTSQPDEIYVQRRHPLNNHDINFSVQLREFEFLKTNEMLYNGEISLLQGALFMLFRNVDAGLSTGTSSPTGTPLGTSEAYLILDFENDSRWEPVAFTGGGSLTPDGFIAQSTSVADPITFLMDPRHQYQLIEVMAPPGFQIPFGQWRISFSSGSFNDPIVIGGGGVTPAFIRSTDSLLNSATHLVPRQSNMFYLGNIRDFNLPLTGGTGTTMYIIAGVWLVSGAAILHVIVRYKKKGKSTA